jgi:pilus assembly protein Flp/PilA
MTKLCRALCNLPSRRLVKRDAGASMVEYGLLIGLIACACLVAITALGGDLSAFFTAAAGKIASATP